MQFISIYNIILEDQGSIMERNLHDCAYYQLQNKLIIRGNAAQVLSAELLLTVKHSGQVLLASFSICPHSC